MATVNTASLTVTAINDPEDQPAVEETDPNENDEIPEDTTVPDTPDPTDPTESVVIDPEKTDPEEPPVITVVDDDGTLPVDDDETVVIDDEIIPYSGDENTDPIDIPLDDDGAEESIDDPPLYDDADKSIPTTTFSLPDAAEEYEGGPIVEISADSPITLSSRHDGQQTRPVGLRMAREFLLQSNKFQQNQYDAILRPSAPTVADFLSYANSADFEMQKIMIAQEIENLHQEMDRTYNEDKFDRNVALYVGSGVSVTFTAGTAAYLLRSGSLLSSFIVSMPLWKGFDPVAVLMYPKKKKKDQRESSDMQEHMISGHNEHTIENMFHDSNER